MWLAHAAAVAIACCLSQHGLTLGRASVAQDQSLRLWNIKTRVIAAVMNGEGGHCNEVLSIVSACRCGVIEWLLSMQRELMNLCS